MITKDDLLAIKKLTDRDVLKIDPNAEFDHIAIKTPNNKTYEELCSSFGGRFREVFQSERNIATILSEFGTLEIMEPKKDEQIQEAFINHVGYVTNNIEEIENKISPLSKFEIGNTKIIFIKPVENLIQVRTRSLKDFSQ